MNNSLLGLESHSLSPEDPNQEIRDAVLRGREQELRRVVEALEIVEASEAWSSLKIDVFEPLRDNLEKKIFLEATKEKPDISVLNSLKGEWQWARRFADLSTFRNEKRVELISVRKQLYGTNE